MGKRERRCCETCQWWKRYVNEIGRNRKLVWNKEDGCCCFKGPGCFASTYYNTFCPNWERNTWRYREDTNAETHYEIPGEKDDA